MKAIDQFERTDFRRRRAEYLTAAIMDELKDILQPYSDDRLLDHVYERLCRVLYENGAHIMTDRDRAEAGLEPRDDLGWTPSERVAYEKARREAMLMHINRLIIPNS